MGNFLDIPVSGVSPDGTMIAYASNQDGDYDIYLMPVEGGVPIKLFDSSKNEKL